ncbi:kinase-like domain-containing protein [Polychytrium aggregatum]|uniref:kinase-like domain-containing protein n=1 Tax=Polychytrium aggregatum TaxID=110093 RepID=UPI0022FEBA3B|nr:kinase-like domain-containing protein [Polychytrium aggregatum]KAI9207419.1 kinase-like domain-containing protein [Polychytrium aggregatum]
MATAPRHTQPLPPRNQLPAQTGSSGSLLAAIAATSTRNTRFSQHLGDYELKETLGRGGFAVVRRAQSLSAGSFGVQVAIKMIDKRLMHQANMTKRVVNEVHIHCQLKHPSILQLLTFFEDDRHVYLVMELCENGELYRYLQKRKSLSEAETRGVMVQIISGLEYLHSNRIVHRDLKLSNLLLTRNYEIKIADFGLAAKLAHHDGEQQTMCGTPNYISPEIVSCEPHGLPSDVWSLGCLMATILTGKPPFESKAVRDTLDRVTRAEYSLPDTLSSDAADLIHRMLQKEPYKRISLSEAMRHSFFAPKSGKTVPLGPPDLPYSEDAHVVVDEHAARQSSRNIEPRITKSRRADEEALPETQLACEYPRMLLWATRRDIVTG